MYSIALLALLAGSEYASVQAAQFTRRQSDTPVALWGACNFPSEGINGPLPCASGSECICKDNTYAQCREQVDGSWTPAGSSWQCQKPGDTATGSSGGTPSPPPATGGDTKAPSGGSNVATGNKPDSGSKAAAQPVTNQKSAANQVGGASNNAAQLPSSGDTSSPAGAPTPATVGDCNSVSAPSGFDGVASTSYYGWMGSACQCGQAPWQWSGTPGFYHAAVNQKLFAGHLNAAGQPNCGSACGQCYQLSTSGTNTYNGGVGSGSTITVQIVDACYSAGDHWCGSTSDGYKDSSNCGVHFDIQTGAPGTDGQAAVGSDGKVWNGGGQIVFYTPVACPGSLSSQYQGCTC